MKREIFVGNVGIGGNHPVSIQSMTSTPTIDYDSTLEQIKRLHIEGCQIVRVAIPSNSALNAFKKIIDKSTLPVIADIHFDHRLAIGAIENGAMGIRINPGNIGSNEKVIQIIDSAKAHKIPIRIGVNSGSIEKKFKTKNKTKIDSMVDSLMDKVRFFEKQNFTNIKLSVKSSDVNETILANRAVNKLCDYPLHLGVTESGTFFSGSMKSAIGLGVLLLENIGNTIRVSLTDDPVNEIKVAKEILKITGHREEGIDFISCPTCARTSVNLIDIANKIENRIKKLNIKKQIRVAVMGCEVNGPGEAKDADIGLAFSKKHGYIFSKGKMIEKVKYENAAEILENYIIKYDRDN